MDALTIATVVLGLIMGTTMLGATTTVYVRHRSFGLGGSVLTAFGTLLLSLSVWKSVEFTVGPDGGITTSFKKEFNEAYDAEFSAGSNSAKLVFDSGSADLNPPSLSKESAALPSVGTVDLSLRPLSKVTEIPVTTVSKTADKLSTDIPVKSLTSLKSGQSLQRLQDREQVDLLVNKGQFKEALAIDPTNTIALMRLIDQNVENARYTEAVSYYDQLVQANQSGVGYSVYADLILAFSKLSDDKTASTLVEALENKIRNDINKGYGYYSRSQQLGWLDEELAGIVGSLDNAKLVSEVKDLRKLINKTIQLLTGLS